MRTLLRLGLGGAIAASAGLFAVVAWPVGGPLAPLDTEGDAGRGAYLARAAGCIACHTDFAGGGAPLAGGVALDTPFGTVHAPNLTTDPDHGIGAWTRAEFARAVRKGVSPDGRPYYPAFPYPFYANFTDQEVADLWAAFQTVAPVADPSKPPEMAFPFDQRWGLKLWRAAYLKPPRTRPVEGRSDIWNRGRNLVEGAAHCGACHTSRNFAGARRIATAKFKGNPDLPGGDKAPPIDRRALRDRGWDVESLAFALRTGITHEGDAFSGGMGEAVLYGTAFLTDADRTAMATYLIHEDEAAEAAPSLNERTDPK